jgi:tetratricopeptide (TPR) repeat protein
LKDSELLYERGVFPESTYIFKHSLVREVLYNSILNKKKRELHRAVGDALEDLHRGSLDEHLDVLADHFMERGEFAKSAKYSRLAGKKAERSGSMLEAIDCAEKRIACLEKLPQTDAVSKETVDARTTLGLCYMQINYPHKAKDAVEPIIELAETIDHKKRLSQIYAIMGDYWSQHQENSPEALKWSRKALDIATAIGDRRSLFFGNYTVGIATLYDCDFGNALRHFQIALEINAKGGSVLGVAAMKSMIALTYIYQGEVRLARQISKEAVQVSEESGDTYSKAMAYTAAGISLFLQGSMNEAGVYLLKGAEFSHKIGFFAWQYFAESFLGSMYMELKNYEKAKSHLAKSVRALNESKLYPSKCIANNIAKVKAQILAGGTEVSVESLYRDASKNRSKATEGTIPRHIAEILLHLDGEQMSQAEDWIRKAVAADARNGMEWNLATDHLVYAEIAKRQKDLSRVREHLNKAIEIFQECGADGWVKRTEERLARL